MQRNISELNSREQALSRNENKAGVMVIEGVNLLEKGKSSSTFNQLLRGTRELARQISILSSLVHKANLHFLKRILSKYWSCTGGIER